MSKKYDIIVLGAGPAGLCSGIYCARYGLNTLVIGKEPGGMVSETSVVENYPGFESITGAELAKKMQNHARASGSDVLIYKNITELRKRDGSFEVCVDNDKFLAKTLIIALGTERRKLNISGEKELSGKGVSYCVTCDGPLYKDKTTAVIGGRNAAVTAALFLAKKCKKVYLIYRRNKLRSDKILTERVVNEKRIEIIYNSNPLLINGNNAVESIAIDQKGNKKDLKVDGVFIEIGAVPATELVTKFLKIKINGNGQIDVNPNMSTNVEGVFAAGDITNGSNNLWQISTAVGEGAIAANSAFKYIKGIKY